MADWQVRAAQLCAAGGIHIQGTNHCARDAGDREFRWQIEHYSLRPGTFERFDFSNVEWGPGARERFEAMRKLALKG